MNLHQFRFIHETIQRNFNLTEVAKKLYISQPGISKAISQFEEELGVTIFNRKAKRLQGMTDIGCEIHQHIQQILFHIEQIKILAQHHNFPDRGFLRIGTTHTQARYTLPKILPEFFARYPEVKIHITQGQPQQIMHLLKEDLIDIAIASEITQDAQCELHPGFNWQHVLIAPKNHPIFAKVITPETMSMHPIITYESAFSGRKKIDEVFANHHLEPNIVLEAADSDIIKTYVDVGMGIGIMAEIAFNGVKDVGLRAHQLGDVFGVHQVKIALKKGKHQRAFTPVFIELLQKHHTS